jgi:asparagine synthase (glutamine-hydrolysing)
MCGIIGIIAQNAEKYKNAVDKISHRGPDSSGYYTQENLLLGHSRLSIQDLSENGNQPMYSADGRYIIIFNGEIYNHKEIRKELLSEISFKSTGDTETILYGFIKYGHEILNKLNGIFAFAVYDRKNDVIFIARDQFGIKPLYYYKDDHKFLFGSEIKSFLTIGIQKELLPSSLLDYVSFLWSPGESTPYKKVKKLLPGFYISFKLSDYKLANPIRYFNIAQIKQDLKYTEQQYIDKLEQLLLKAVDRQLLSDVPVGFFLSGGLDSSLLVAMARKLYPDRPIQCFTIDVGYEEAKKEGFAVDLFYAKKVAKELKLELNIVKADIDITQFFDKMIWHLDEPQADAAPLNVLKIAKLAREKNIKVLIGGTGGDDLFSGYRRHQALHYERGVERIPLFLRQFVKKIAQFLPSTFPAFRRFKKLTYNFEKSSIERQLGFFEWLPNNLAKSLFTPELKLKLNDIEPFEYFLKIQKDLPNATSNLDRMLFWELKTFLVDHNLNYTDKMAMAVGVEARVPFLDLDLVQFSRNIPDSLKMRNNEVKYILKKVAERYLPNEIIYRPKTGFGAPVRKWITSDLQPMIDERLSIDRIKARGIFNPDAVWDLINQNKSGKIDASYSIWALLAIESWCMQFVDGIELYKVKNKVK